MFLRAVLDWNWRPNRLYLWAFRVIVCGTASQYQKNEVLMQPEPTIGQKLKNLVIGKSRSPRDTRIFHKLSLIAFFAWVGLGADGLSSSCYGPQEAFLDAGSSSVFGCFRRDCLGPDDFRYQRKLLANSRAFPDGRRRLSCRQQIIIARAWDALRLRTANRLRPDNRRLNRQRRRRDMQFASFEMAVISPLALRWALWC